METDADNNTIDEADISMKSVADDSFEELIRLVYDSCKEEEENQHRRAGRRRNPRENLGAKQSWETPKDEHSRESQKSGQLKVRFKFKNTRELRRRESFLGSFGSIDAQESLQPEKESRNQSSQSTSIPPPQMHLGLFRGLKTPDFTNQGKITRL